MTSEPFDPYRKWLGISPQDCPPNHYRLLGLVLFEDDADVIQNAADRQMLHVKSMAGGKHAAIAQQILNELSAARVCLLVPATKAAYDLQLRGKLASRNAARPAPSEEAVLPPPIATTPLPAIAAAPVPAPFATAPLPAAPSITIEPWAPPLAGTPTGMQVKRRRQAAGAWITTAVCIAAILVLGIATFLFREELFGSEKASPSSRKKLVAVNAAVKSDPTSEPAGDPLPEANPAGFEPAATRPSVDPEVIRQHLWEARKALAQRAYPAAKIRLDKAAALMETQPVELAEELSADLEHWRGAETNLETFWSGVRDAIRELLPRDQSHIVGDDEVRLLGGEGDVVTYLLNGSQSLSEVDELPARVAVVLASKGLEGDAAKRSAALATFILMDRNAIDEGPPRELAESIAAEAPEKAEPNPTVARLLQEALAEAQRAANESLSQDFDSRLSSRAAGSPAADLSTVDPLQLVDRTAILAVKKRLQNEQQEQIARASRDPAEAAAYVKELADWAGQSPDEPTRCAHLELALDTAAAACLAGEVSPLADEFAAASGQNPDALKHFYLARCEPRTASQAKKLYDEARALMERAELLREPGLALKFWEVAALAAHKTKDLGLQRALVEKRAQLEAAGR